MEKCQSLPDYVVFVDTVRRYINQGYITRRAVDMAVEECIAKDILREFLVRNKTGVMRKLFGKEDWERYKQREMKVLAEETVRRDSWQREQSQLRNFRGSRRHYIEVVCENNKSL